MGSSSPLCSESWDPPPNKTLARENKTNRKSLNKELEKKMRATIKPPSIFPAIEQFFFSILLIGSSFFFLKKFHYYQLTFDKVINQSQQSQCPQIH